MYSRTNVYLRFIVYATILMFVSQLLGTISNSVFVSNNLLQIVTTLFVGISFLYLTIVTILLWIDLYRYLKHSIIFITSDFSFQNNKITLRIKRISKTYNPITNTQVKLCVFRC